MKKAVITGRTKLAKAITFADSDIMVDSARVEDAIQWHEYDIFINCAHVDFEQVNLLEEAVQARGNDENFTIVNISSRAARPNISPGKLYASQKAALNHMADNYKFNSDIRCNIQTINFGLLNHEYVSSISYEEAAKWVHTVIKNPTISDITLQHPENYNQVQADKELMKDIERLLL